MATNTAFNPSNNTEFDKSKMNKDAQGFFFTATAGQETTNNQAVTNDYLMTGGAVLLVKGGAWGDKVTFQVVHPIAGVVGQFLTNWPINPDSTLQSLPPANYPAKIFAGLTLRAVYTSVGESDVKVAIGYNLEKVLI
jgi:hypothetical protein